MQEKQVLECAFAMPLTSPAYPRGPYRFVNREYLIITYRTDPARLRAVVPEPLELDQREALVKYEFIRMPDSNGFGDYTESGQVIPVSFRGRKGSYTHCMFLNDEGPIAGGRELWGFPKKLAQPTLRTEIDTLVGTLDYGPLRVATGTMGYKHREVDLAQVKDSLAAPNFLLKIIPHVDGTARICELVEYHLEDVTIRGAWTGPAALHLSPHALAPVVDFAGARDRVCDPHPCGLDARLGQGRARLFTATKPTSAAHQRNGFGEITGCSTQMHERVRSLQFDSGDRNEVAPPLARWRPPVRATGQSGELVRKTIADCHGIVGRRSDNAGTAS